MTEKSCREFTEMLARCWKHTCPCRQDIRLGYVEAEKLMFEILKGAPAAAALDEKSAAVICRSLVIGRPVAMLLMHANATVAICHTRTKDMPSIIREADIVVAAAGCAETMTSEYFTGSQIVLDVGISWSEAKGKLVGDVGFDAAEHVILALTPVPGGVGSVITAVLASHVAEAAGKAAGI